MPQKADHEIADNPIFLRIAQAVRPHDWDSSEPDEATETVVRTMAKFVIDGDDREGALAACGAAINGASREWRVLAGQRLRARLDGGRLDWLTPVQLRRLAQLCAHDLDTDTDWRAELRATRGSSAPSWFMLIQLLSAKAWRSETQSLFWWDPSFFVPLLTLEEEQHDRVAQQAISAFFVATPSSWEYRARRDLLSSRAWVDYVRANIDLVPGVVASLDVGDRTTALRWLGLDRDIVRGVAPMLAELAAGTAKTVRESAAALIGDMDEPLRSQTLAAALAVARPSTVGTVIAVAASLGEPGHALLSDALAQGGPCAEPVAAAVAAYRRASSTAELLVPPCPPLDTTEVGEDFVAMIDAARRRGTAHLKKRGHPGDVSLLEQFEQIGPSDLAAVRDWLNGRGTRPATSMRLIDAMLGCGVLRAHDLRLHLVSLVRLATCRKGSASVRTDWRMVRRLSDRDYDLRSLAEAARLATIADPVAQIEEVGLNSNYPPGLVWPFFAEHQQRLDEVLGLLPASGYRHRGAALRVLAAFPTLPPKYVRAVSEIALAETKDDRREAQQILEKCPDVLVIATEGLKSSRSRVRTVAATWLGQIGDPDAVAALRAAVAKEKRDEPKTAMLRSLHALSGDISAYPQVLAAAAAKGLNAQLPAYISWFPFDGLPACRWADGTDVDPQIVQWWVVRAARLKDPTGADEIGVYLSLLDAASQDALGTFVLDTWVAHDTRPLPQQVCRERAEALVPERRAKYHDAAQRHPCTQCHRRAQMTDTELFDELFAEQTNNEYLADALGCRGLLALTTRASGARVVATFEAYLRDRAWRHYTSWARQPQRNTQLETLLTAASANDDPHTTELVLSAARTFPRTSVRTCAAALVKQIAARRGWTPEQLEDQTIDTAGLDAAGTLAVDYGPRAWTAYVARTKNGTFTLALSTPDGRPVKTLPAPGPDDDPDLAAQARAQLAASKKELTGTGRTQSARLTEALHLERSWDMPGWQVLA
ncbi:MAG: hypothetical protein FWD11_10185, partial [Micrococcales bacterium]|nr:hypothetical protein [Micrococcales bacterium]